MRTVTPTEIEQAAVDAISKVVSVSHSKRLDDGAPGKTPDWRLTFSDGRVADVEVTEATDEAERRLFGAVQTKEGSVKEWPCAKLSYRWMVMVDDRDPAFNKKRRPLEKVAADAFVILTAVEEMDGGPDQMALHASALFDGGDVFFRSSADTMTMIGSDGLQIRDGERSQRLVVCGPPERVGPSQGSVELHPMTVGSSVGCRTLVADVQEAIDEKTKKQQMDQAPDLGWLAVMVEGLAASELKVYFGPGSRFYDHETQQHPPLRTTTFDYFDEVWVCSLGGPVVLRLSDGGAHTTVHHV